MVTGIRMKHGSWKFYRATAIDPSIPVTSPINWFDKWYRTGMDYIDVRNTVYRELRSLDII